MIKQVLFVSGSRLSHNLLKAMLPLVPSKVEIDYCEDFDSALNTPKRGRPYLLVLVDWNVIMPLGDLRGEIARLKGHPRFKSGRFFLLYPHQAGEQVKGHVGELFDACYPKPLLTDEIAAMIQKGISKGS